MFKGIISVLLAAIFWGTGGVCGQYLFTHSHIDAVWMVMVRQIVAGSLFLCYSKFILKDKLLELWREYPLQTLVFSFPGILGAQLGFYYTISLCNAATATILQYTAPIMVVLWMSFKKKAWPEKRVILGTILAFTGVFLISTHGSLDSWRFLPWLFVLVYFLPFPIPYIAFSRLSFCRGFPPQQSLAGGS